MKVTFGNKSFSQDENSVLIIAEAGVNHDGDISKAFKLIDIAFDAGADAIKFQAFKTEKLIKAGVQKAKYQINVGSSSESQFEMLKSLELKSNEFKRLKDYSESKGLLFLTTPFDLESLETLIDIDLLAYKVASTDTTNLPFLIQIAEKTDVPILLSTGMCYFEEVKKAISILSENNKQIVLMQCTSDYPTDDSEINLNVLNTYRNFENCLLGFSDHSIGYEASLMAIAMGSRVIEKHFTVNSSDPGPDHAASLEPEELSSFVKKIRRAEKMLGSQKKEPTISEIDNRKKLQKSLVAKRIIKEGEPFTLENIVAMRIGVDGLSPIYFEKLLANKASKDYLEGESLLIEEIR